jgi:hypothetical protein
MFGLRLSGGLCQDVELVLQRENGSASARRWRLIYRIDQRYVKSSRDLENVVYVFPFRLYPFRTSHQR